MSRLTPPEKPVNRYTHMVRLEACEIVAANALTAAKSAHERLDHAAPKGERGEVGPAGLSIVGPAGRDGADGKPGRDAVGIQGPQGASITGPRGERGLTGADSTVAGPQGARGFQGAPGKDSVVPGPQGPPGPDTAAVLADARTEIFNLRAEVRELTAVVQGLVDQSKLTGAYIAWLKERSAARTKK
ncbi:MAG: hypothetical protein WB566_05685 [Terriglobales bacterium]